MILLKKLSNQLDTKLVEIVNNIDTSEFDTTDKTELENTIPDTSRLVKETDYNSGITEIENKIPSISVLATNSALTAIEDLIGKSSLFSISSNFKVLHSKEQLDYRMEIKGIA